MRVFSGSPVVDRILCFVAFTELILFYMFMSVAGSFGGLFPLFWKVSNAGCFVMC